MKDVDFPTEAEIEVLKNSKKLNNPELSDSEAENFAIGELMQIKEKRVGQGSKTA